MDGMGWMAISNTTSANNKMASCGRRCSVHALLLLCVGALHERKEEIWERKQENFGKSTVTMWSQVTTRPPQHVIFNGKGATKTFQQNISKRDSTKSFNIRLWKRKHWQKRTCKSNIHSTWVGDNFQRFMFYPENEAYAKPTISTHLMAINCLKHQLAPSFVCMIAKRRRTDELRPVDND